MDRNMKKKKYTNEFKQQAVALAGSLSSLSEAARQLGVSDGSIHAWRAKQMLAGIATTPAGELSVSEADELRRLRGEVTQLRKVNHILKAAAAFFSQDHLK
jgi:transposase